MGKYGNYGYTVAPEFCGQPTRRYVVRQYGEWVGQFLTRSEALAAIRNSGGHLAEGVA